MNGTSDDFWTLSSLYRKTSLWSTNLIQSFFIPLAKIQSNERIYDIGSGFSPLGIKLAPYLLPHGKITGFDINRDLVDQANYFAQEKKLANVSFKHGDIFKMNRMTMEKVDLTMCQQLLVNLSDYRTALENMIIITKEEGRIMCIENINYGAYIHRPDLSWKINLQLSQIWQKLCTHGKFSIDHATTTLGADLPQIFAELGLFNIQFQILSPSSFPMPPYDETFVQQYIKSYITEKQHLRHIVSLWNQRTGLSQSDLEFFSHYVLDSDYDLHAVQNNLFITQWFYPLMVIVGWLKKQKPVIPKQENIKLIVD